MKPFFKVQSLDQVLAHAREVGPLPPEEVTLDEALGRVLARDFVAPHDLPGFTRACMDGFAVRSSDTFGASEALPSYLSLAGEVYMGQSPDFALAPSQCGRIMTGGELPLGADAVVIVEHTSYLDGTTVEVTRPVAPGANVLGPRDDAVWGQVILPTGRRLRPQDLGLLAALGCKRVSVARQPRVGIISTGDEVVPVSATPRPGQVRDVNTHTLSAAVRVAGGLPRSLGLIADDEAALKVTVADSLAHDDLTLLSGGSSVGARDLTEQVFTTIVGAELLVHGVAVAPGKPFIWVRAGQNNLLGLPGQVASCLVAFYVLAEPVIERLLGREPVPFTRFGRARARLTRNLPSVHGREEYLRVSLTEKDGQVLAAPVFGKSGLLRTLVEGDGLVRVARDCEGIKAGTKVTVLIWPSGC
jgi:molybdopterin molybdotransferase